MGSREASPGRDGDNPKDQRRQTWLHIRHARSAESWTAVPSGTERWRLIISRSLTQHCETFSIGAFHKEKAGPWMRLLFPMCLWTHRLRVSLPSSTVQVYLPLFCCLLSVYHTIAPYLLHYSVTTCGQRLYEQKCHLRWELSRHWELRRDEISSSSYQDRNL